KITMEQLREALKSVKAPGASLNILDARQLVRFDLQEKSLLLDVELPEVNPLLEKSLRFQIEKVVHDLDPDLNVTIQFKKSTRIQNRVGTMIAVGSGKGGVGKSSLAVNL